MYEIARNLTGEFFTRDTELQNFKNNMARGFNSFSTKLQHLLKDSEWSLDVIDGNHCEISDDFAFHTDIILHNSKNGMDFKLNIKFEHLSKIKYGITVQDTQSVFNFYDSSFYDEDNMRNLCDILRCFTVHFPPVIPTAIKNF